MTRPSGSAAKTSEVIDPRWLLRAAAVAVAGALLLAYACLCLLFWQGQWQLVLTPSSAVTTGPASMGLVFEPVTFGRDHLTGWWLPSDNPADPTVMLLHDGKGSMSDALPTVQALHAARLNVFVFDYRGFGKSAGSHPNEARMQQDAAGALDYLLYTRNIPLNHLLLCGEGLGASLATGLAAQHPDLPGLMLLHPNGDLAAQVRRDSRARFVPLFLLFHETFPLAGALRTLAMPKLILTTENGPNRFQPQDIADPKLTVELPANTVTPAEPLLSIRRFLDTYVPHPPAELHP